MLPLLFIAGCKSVPIGPGPGGRFIPVDTGFFEADVDTDVDTDSDSDVDTDVDADEDGDGYYYWEDCNDFDSGIFDGAPEACDDLDNDCDGIVDNPVPGNFILYVDDDGDGYGDLETMVTEADLCPLAPGLSTRRGDCDDADDTVHPTQVDDQCDGVDDNCDGRPDDGAPGARFWFYDTDGDGFAGDARFGCMEPGAQETGNDCDESRADVNPSAQEIWFDGIDQNCDGNDTNPPDRDADGFHEVDDCDDLSVTVNPSVDEACGNNIDDNCDGAVDEGCDGVRPADPPVQKGCQTYRLDVRYDWLRRR